MYGDVRWGDPTLSFVLFTINVECMCDASYVTWKYRQKISYVIFARKYKTVQNVNILGARLVVAPHYLNFTLAFFLNVYPT